MPSLASKDCWATCTGPECRLALGLAHHPDQEPRS